VGFVGVLLGLKGLVGLFLWIVGRVLVGCCFGLLLLVLVGALSELGFLWVHLGALSYTFCIIGWRPL
jgi:hypothetical protein